MSLNATSTLAWGYTFAASRGAVPSADFEPLSYLYPHHSVAVAASLVATTEALVNPRGKGIYATDETIEGIASVGSAGGSVFTNRFRLVCISSQRGTQLQPCLISET